MLSACSIRGGVVREVLGADAMSEYEVRTADNLAIRVLAEDELEALETAAPMIEGDAEGSVYPVTEPVGAAGTDPEEPSDDPDGPNRVRR